MSAPTPIQSAGSPWNSTTGPLTYADLKAAYIAHFDNPSNAPFIQPGPATDADLELASPGPCVFFAIGGGAGLSLEAAFDRPFVEVYVIGDQGDDDVGYTSSESIALDLDGWLLGIDTATTIGETLVLCFNRVGGRPNLVRRDSAKRYHFQCSYIAETDSGI